MDGFTRTSLRGRLTSHCLLVEAGDSLVLVDTGYGLRDVADPRGRLSAFFRVLAAPELREEMTAVRQIERLGFRARDVRHIVLSHLDFDHAGGLDDFPAATVHLFAQEVVAAAAQRTWLDRRRFRPQQWDSRARWRLYPMAEGERWYGFEHVRGVDGVAGVLLVPLVGHTLGHAGVAVRRDRDWLFYAGDAYFYHREMDPDRARCTPGLRVYQTMLAKDRGLRLANRERVRALARRGGDVQVFCAHDVRELERLAGRPFGEPIGSDGARRREPGLADVVPLRPA
jgi:glyoxylase-like metal-dependent hydrolase (beta-lactamase superfamily II)